MDVGVNVLDLKKIFKIADRRILWFQLLIFTIICCLLLLKPLSYALFIEKVGIYHLPYAFVLIALVSVVFTYIYSRFVIGKDALTLLIYSCIVSIVVLLGLFLGNIFAPNFDISHYILFIFVALFGLMTASQFWLAVNILLDKRTVKKNIAKLGTFAILGGITGGYIATLWSLIFSAESILILVSILLCAVISISLHIKKIYKFKKNGSKRSIAKGKELLTDSPWKLVWETKHLKLLSLIVGLSVLAAKLIDYEYSYFASISFDTEEELTGFFGFWLANVSFFSLGIQVFLTERFIGKLGIGKSLYILPGVLIFGALGLLFLPIILFALILKLSEGSLKQTIHKSSIELILLPIPQLLKLKTKTFIDVTIDSLATGFCGILLLIIIGTLGLPNYWVLLLLVVVLALWIFLINQVREEYIRTFRLSLHINENKKDKNATILKSYREILDAGDSYRRIKILSKMDTLQISQLKESILPLIHSDNDMIVVKSLERLNELDHDFGKEVLPMLSHKDAGIRLAVFRYLILHNEALDVNFFMDKLNDSDYMVRATSILALAIEYQNQPKILQLLQIEKRTEDLLSFVNDDKNSMLKIELWIAIFNIIAQGRFEKYYDLLLNAVHTDGPLQEHAMMALGHTDTKAYIEDILNIMMANDNMILAGTKALEKFEFDVLSEFALGLWHNGDYRRLQYFPDVFARFHNMLSVKLLLKFSESKDKSLARKSIASINDIVSEDALIPLDKSMINKRLIKEIEYYQELVKGFGEIYHHITESDEKQYFYEKINIIYRNIVDQQLETIFNLLNIKYLPEEIISLMPLFKSRDEEKRNNAIEYLENLLAPNIKDILIPILENPLTDLPSKASKMTIDSEEFHSSIIKIKDQELRKRLLRFFEHEIQALQQ